MIKIINTRKGGVHKFTNGVWTAYPFFHWVIFIRGWDDESAD